MTTIASDPLLGALPAWAWDSHTKPFRTDGPRPGWHVFSADDVISTLTSPELISQGALANPDDLHPNNAAMWFADDPRHGRLRGAVNDPFRREALDALAPIIAGKAAGLVDAIWAARRPFDVAAQLAEPLAGHTICTILGVDPAAATPFWQWLREYTKIMSLGQLPKQPKLVEYLEHIIAGRDRDRRPGLLTDLLRAKDENYEVEDGKPLSKRDMVGYAWTFLAAGMETTAASVGNLLLFLSEYGAWDDVTDDPGVRDSAIEEVWRWFPPFTSVPGKLRRDCTFAGQPMREGDMLSAWLTSASRDPAVFSDPDVFDIRRSPNPHLAFGRGVHHCLGAPLARMVMRTLLDIAVERLPGLRWASAAPFRRGQGIVAGPQEAWMTFQA